MNRAENAAVLFDRNANCSQSVFQAFAGDYGVEDAVALRIATGFGGGMRIPSVCGAVTGAFMALGLARGMGSVAEQDKKKATYALVQEFTRRFTQKHGSVMCADLLGVDIMTAEGNKKASDQGLFGTKCRQFVSDAVTILETMLAEEA